MTGYCWPKASIVEKLRKQLYQALFLQLVSSIVKENSL